MSDTHNIAPTVARTAEPRAARPNHEVMGTVVLCNGMDWRSSVVLLTLLIGGLGADASTGAQNGTPAAPRPVAEIQFSRLKPDAVLAVELEPGAVVDADGVWVAQRQSGAIVRIEAKTNALGKPMTLGKPLCASLLVAFDSIWAPSCQDGTVARIEVKGGNVTASMPLPVVQPSVSVAVAVGSVWALTDDKGVVSRVKQQVHRRGVCGRQTRWNRCR
jgi:hypothetical protein